MKGTEKIIAHIEADAQGQADAILNEARDQCAAIQKAYEEKAAYLYSDRIREGVKLCQEQEDSALRITRMEARKSVLSVKQEMVEKSFDLATQMIISLPDEKYVAFLADLVKKAGPDGDEEIILNAADRTRIGDALIKAVNDDGAKMKLADETRDMKGGLILRRGSIETNCSVELLVELCRGELSAKLADVLFD